VSEEDIKPQPLEAAESPPTTLAPPPALASQNSRISNSELSQSRPASPIRSPSPTEQPSHSNLSEAFDYLQENQSFRNHPFNQDIVIPEGTFHDGFPQENAPVLPDVQSLEEQCQYYSDMYQQLSEQYNAMLQDFQFCQESLSNLQVEYGTVNAQYSDLMHICSARDKEIDDLKQSIHQLEFSNRELLQKKETELEQLKLQMKLVAVSQLDTNEDMEEAIRARMKNALLDLDAQSAQLKERKQWCRNEEDRLQKWEEDLTREKSKLMDLEATLHQRSESLNKKEHSIDKLGEELSQQRAKLEQGQDWLRMEEEELAEKQKRNAALLEEKTRKMQALEEELSYRDQQIQALQARLDTQHIEFEGQITEMKTVIDAQKLELEQLVSIQSAEKSSVLGLAQEPMTPEEVHHWIEYYNSKCSDLDRVKNDLLNEKESYKALSMQLQEQLESFTNQLEHHPVKQVVSEENEQRELALRKREKALEEKMKALELHNRRSPTNDSNQIIQMLERIESLCQVMQSREIMPLQVPELRHLTDRISNLETTNQQLMNYLSSMQQKLDVYKPSSTSDFCNAITELSR
jgi:DNA repair exonuclease SbcCD ATPase subunit